MTAEELRELLVAADAVYAFGSDMQRYHALGRAIGALKEWEAAGVVPRAETPTTTAAEAEYQRPVEEAVQRVADQLKPYTLQDRIAQWRGQQLTPTPAASDFERGYAEGRNFAFDRCADEAELTLRAETPTPQESKRPEDHPMKEQTLMAEDRGVSGLPDWSV